MLTALTGSHPYRPFSHRPFSCLKKHHLPLPPPPGPEEYGLGAGPWAFLPAPVKGLGQGREGRNLHLLSKYSVPGPQLHLNLSLPWGSIHFWFVSYRGVKEGSNRLSTNLPQVTESQNSCWPVPLSSAYTCVSWDVNHNGDGSYHYQALITCQHVGTLPAAPHLIPTATF